MSGTLKYDVALCGGGIGGLTAALALSAKGFSSIIVERMDTPSSHGSGLQIGPNASHVLSDLGLLSDLLNVATQPERIKIQDLKTASEITTIPLGKTAYKKYHAPYLVIHRADLHYLLTKKAIEHPLIDFCSGFFAEKFVDHGDRVELISTEKESFETDILIGTDGLWSVIRKQLHGDTLPRNSGQIAWRALVPTSKISKDWLTPQSGVWLGANKHIVTYPVKGGVDIKMVIVTMGKVPGLGWSELGNKYDLLKLLGDVHKSLIDLIEAAPEFRLWQLHDRDPLAQWGQGRVSLLGDAAHPMLPHLAQGAGMAIEDSYVLAHCLSQQRGNLAAGLRRYETLRKPRTDHVQAASRHQSKNYHMDSLQGKVRNFTLGLAGKIMPTKLLYHYDWLYEVSLNDMISGSAK